jgi:hypothetical protein
LTPLQITVVHWPKAPALFTVGNKRVLWVYAWSAQYGQMVKLVAKKSGEPGVIEVTLDDLFSAPEGIGVMLQTFLGEAAKLARM